VEERRQAGPDAVASDAQPRERDSLWEEIDHRIGEAAVLVGGEH
jgi:hypothetical protein